MDFGHDAPLEAEERMEHNGGNPSLEVVVQGLSGWLVHLFLEAWEPARVPVSCHLAFDLSLSRNARRLAVIALPQFCCPLLQRLDAFPSWKGCNCMEWDAMGEQRNASLHEEMSEEDWE